MAGRAVAIQEKALGTGHPDLAVVLNNLRGVIGEAHVNYSSTEASNAALWGG